MGKSSSALEAELNALRRAHRDLEARARDRAVKLEQANRQLQREIEERTRAESELRKLQSRLIHAERLGAAEDFAASVAHTINNPLTALIGTVELALESPPGTEADLERMLALARRIRAVVQRTLQLYRSGTLDLTLEEPARLVDDVRSELEGRAALQGVDIQTKSEADVPPVLVDRTLLTAALIGIAENALDAMNGGGTLWIESASIPRTRAVEFRIADSGAGIPEDLHDKVFEPFFTTKGGGSGLGLAIAQGVVRGHEGRIQIRERPGGGALVIVEVPARAA